MKDKQQTYILVGLLAAFAAVLGVAYWYSGQERTAKASTASSVPVKKFRAKPGTERKNVRALLSSVPSVPEETTARPIEIWGSLERDDGPRKKELKVVEAALDLEDPEEGIKQLEALFEDRGEEELDPASLSSVHAALASLYVQMDPPDTARAEEAYERALAEAAGSGAQISVVYIYSDGLLDAELYERLAEVADVDGFEAYPLSAALLEVGVLLGVALEQLERYEDAQHAYEEVIDAAIVSDGDMSERAANVFRQASLRLARLYSLQGRTAEAKAVARRVQALLEG